MPKDNVLILKVNKNKNNQLRVTIPKELNSEYVAIRPVNVDNIFKAKRRYFK